MNVLAYHLPLPFWFSEINQQFLIVWILKQALKVLNFLARAVREVKADGKFLVAEFLSNESYCNKIKENI